MPGLQDTSPSDLKDIFINVCHAVVNYIEKKTGRRVSSKEEVTTNVYNEASRNEILLKMIKDLSINPTVAPSKGLLLEYFVSTVNNVQPLLDLKTPYNAAQVAYIRDTTTQLVITCSELLNMWSSNFKVIKYTSLDGNDSFSTTVYGLYGFPNYAELGKQVKEKIVDSFTAKDLSNCANHVSNLIAAHQAPIKDAAIAGATLPEAHTSAQTSSNNKMLELLIPLPAQGSLTRAASQEALYSDIPPTLSHLEGMSSDELSPQGSPNNQRIGVSSRGAEDEAREPHTPHENKADKHDASTKPSSASLTSLGLHSRRKAVSKGIDPTASSASSASCGSGQ